MIKLSFIIPVFNTAAYIEKCINSCLSQDIHKTEFEIILIDDGSTDGSLDILNNFATNNKNIKVISQSNQKQGAARNNGLNLAQGKYVWFVDSDDWIEKNILEELLSFADKEKPDLLRFDASDFFPDLNKIEKRSCGHKTNKLYSYKEAFLENDFLVCTPFYIFKRSFLIENNLSFPEGIFYEDNYFMVKVFFELETFQYLSKNYYFVNKRNNSSTRTSDFERKLDIVKVIQKQVNFVENNKMEPMERKVFGKKISVNFNSALIALAPSPSIFHTAIKILKDIDGLKDLIKESGSTLHYLEYKLTNKPTLLRSLLKSYYY